MPGSPEGSDLGEGEEGKNPFLLPPEEQEAAMAERQAGEGVRREPVALNPDDLSDAAKARAMERAFMTQAEIDAYFAERRDKE